MKIIKLVSLLVVFVVVSCSIENPPETKELTDEIILNTLRKENEHIILNWSILKDPEFESYEVLRSESKQPDSFESLTIVSNNQKTDYIDTDVPFDPQVSYKIVGHLNQNSASIESNTEIYGRPEILALNGQIDQVIPQFEKNRFFLIDRNGFISILDYQKQEIIKTLSIESRIGYADIHKYNGKEELYVPRNDGWIYIYDANTFELLDRIDTGRASSSIVYSLNKLFVSTDAWTQKPLKIYDRQSGEIIEETGDFELTRIRKVPNTATDILEISLSIAPVDQDFYRFDNDGMLLEHRDDIYHGDFDLDANIFNFFPDTNYFITGRKGAIYDIDMIYQSRLPQGYLEFSSFGFNEDENIIYAGCSNERSIQKYDLNDFSQQGFIKTESYPQFIFRINQQIIIIGRSSRSYNSRFIFEIINL